MIKQLLFLFIILLSIVGIASASAGYNYNADTKTASILNSGTIRLISINQDLTSMEEVFEIIPSKSITFQSSKLNVRFNKLKGSGIISTTWLYLKPGTMTVDINDYGIVQRYRIEYNNITKKNETIQYDSHEIVGTHTEVRDNSAWKPFPTSINLIAGNIYTVKVIYTKKAKIGSIKIQTIPSFFDTEIPEFTWWNTSWSHSINNAIPDGSRPYQISMNISNSTGTNNVTHVFCNGHCNVNFTDIRFILNNTTALPYWIENNITGKVWVNVTANGTVNMYYGNPTATSISDGTNTFPFFEDFSVNVGTSSTAVPNARWVKTYNNGGTFGAIDGIGTWLGTGTSGDTWGTWGTTSAYYQSVPSMTEIRAKMTETEACIFGAGIPSGQGATDMVELGYEGAGKKYWLKNSGVETTYARTTDASTWKIFGFSVLGTNSTWYEDRILTNTVNSATYTPNSPIGIDLRITYSPTQLNMDWIFIRNYALTEPAWSTWETETFSSYCNWCMGVNVTVYNNGSAKTYNPTGTAEGNLTLVFFTDTGTNDAITYNLTTDTLTLKQFNHSSNNWSARVRFILSNVTSSTNFTIKRYNSTNVNIANQWIVSNSTGYIVYNTTLFNGSEYTIITTTTPTTPVTVLIGVATVIIGGVAYYLKRVRKI